MSHNDTVDKKVYREAAKLLIKGLEGRGYVIVKRAELIKKAGLIVAEELGVK